MRRTSITAAIAAIVAVTASAVPASAQILWDTPPLVSHVAPSGVSLFVTDPAGGDLGGLMTFRHSAGPVGMGYRFAISDEDGSDDLALAGGIDVSGFLSRAVEGSEIDVMWWSGGGVGIGREVAVTVPLGILIGWSGEGGEAILSPYGGGHIALDITSNDADNIDLSGTVDLGLDVVLRSGWIIRFGASLGDRDALAIGARISS